MIYIYTVCYNTPQYIEPQYKLLKKYITDEFQYIVFNNTMTDSFLTKQNDINNDILIDVCNKYKITYYDLPKNIFNGMHKNASLRAGTAINASHNILFKNYSLDNIFFLIDTDAFLLSPFNVNKFMTDKTLSGRIQYRQGSTCIIKYITNHIVIFKPLNFDSECFRKYFSFLPCNIIDGKTIVNCDCGGNFHFLFDKMEDKDFVNWKNNLFSKSGNNKQLYGGSPEEDVDFNYDYLNKLDSNIKDFINNDTKSLNKKHPFCEIFTNDLNDVLFLHLRAGTNWIGYDFTHRENMLSLFFASILKD